MDDMNNLKDFLHYKTMTGPEGDYYGIEDFSVDELKELRYLATLALVEKLGSEHGEIMRAVLKDVEK